MVIDLCKHCDLCLTARSQLAGEGSDNPDILFLFDFPNTSQDAKGDFYAGKKMTAFKRALDVYGIHPYSHVSHVLKCRPPQVDAMDYKKLELDSNHCSKRHFLKEFNTIYKRVKIIVTIGKFAYQFITGERNISIKAYEDKIGSIDKFGNYIVIALPHLTVLYDNAKIGETISNIADFYGNNYNHHVKIANTIRRNTIPCF